MPFYLFLGAFFSFRIHHLRVPHWHSAFEESLMDSTCNACSEISVRAQKVTSQTRRLPPKKSTKTCAFQKNRNLHSTLSASFHCSSVSVTKHRRKFLQDMRKIEHLSGQRTFCTCGRLETLNMPGQQFESLMGTIAPRLGKCDLIGPVMNWGAIFYFGWHWH
jgi:hypothetical protein